MKDFRLYTTHTWNALLFQIEKRYRHVFTFLIWFEVHIQQFFGLKFYKYTIQEALISVCRLYLQIHQKIKPYILGSLNKSKIPGFYRFPLGNPHKVTSSSPMRGWILPRCIHVCGGDRKWSKSLASIAQKSPHCPPSISRTATYCPYFTSIDRP